MTENTHIHVSIPGKEILYLKPTDDGVLHLKSHAPDAKHVKYRMDLEGSWKYLPVKVHYSIMVWAGVYML